MRGYGVISTFLLAMMPSQALAADRHFVQGKCYVRPNVRSYAVAAGNRAQSQIVMFLPRGATWSQNAGATGAAREWSLQKVRDILTPMFDANTEESSVQDLAQRFGISVSQARKEREDTKRYLIAVLQKAGVNIGREAIIEDEAFSYTLVSSQLLNIDDNTKYCVVTVKTIVDR